MSENDPNETDDLRSLQDLKLNAVTAKRFFFQYHKNGDTAHPGIDNSQGKLKVNDNGHLKAIQHFVLRADILTALRQEVERVNFIFIGIAALPATQDDGSDTLLLVAIAENNQGKQFYFLPPNTTDVNYIFDYVQTCPKFCRHIDNHQKVWDSWIQ